MAARTLRFGAELVDGAGRCLNAARDGFVLPLIAVRVHPDLTCASAAPHRSVSENPSNSTQSAILPTYRSVREARLLRRCAYSGKPFSSSANARARDAHRESCMFRVHFSRLLANCGRRMREGPACIIPLSRGEHAVIPASDSCFSSRPLVRLRGSLLWMNADEFGGPCFCCIARRYAMRHKPENENGSDTMGQVGGSSLSGRYHCASVSRSTSLGSMGISAAKVAVSCLTAPSCFVRAPERKRSSRCTCLCSGLALHWVMRASAVADRIISGLQDDVRQEVTKCRRADISSTCDLLHYDHGREQRQLSNAPEKNLTGLYVMVLRAIIATTSCTNSLAMNIFSVRRPEPDTNLLADRQPAG